MTVLPADVHDAGPFLLVRQNGFQLMLMMLALVAGLEELCPADAHDGGPFGQKRFQLMLMMLALLLLCQDGFQPTFMMLALFSGFPKAVSS